MKKILLIIVLLLFGNSAFSETKLQDYVSEEFSEKKTEGPTFVESPRDAAKKFIKDNGFQLGLNTRPNGSTFFIAIGQGPVTAGNDSPDIHLARSMGFQRAFLNAKAEMVTFLQLEVTASIEASVKQNTMPEPENLPEEIIKKVVGPDSSQYEKLKKLIGLKLDRALKEEGYDPNAPVEVKKKIIEKVVASRSIKTFYTSMAQQTITGFQALTVFEESNAGDRSMITVVGIWSPKLSKLANAIKFGKFVAPKGVPKKPIMEQVPHEDPEKMLQSFGAQMFVDENGNLGIVSYGHGGPQKENRADLLTDACDQAKLRSIRNIVFFVNESIIYKDALDEVDTAEDYEREGQELYRSMQGVDYDQYIKAQGSMKELVTQELVQRVIQDKSKFNQTDCVHVRYWSPDLQKASAEGKKQILDSLSNSSSDTTSSSGNTEAQESTQGSTGSLDF